MTFEQPNKVDAIPETSAYLRKSFSDPTPPSEEREVEILEQLERVTDILKDLQAPWYVCGGLSMDMVDLPLDRDHEDVDILIPSAAAGDVWDFAQRNNFSLVTHDGVELTSLQELSSVPAHIGGIIVRSKAAGTSVPLFEFIFIAFDEQTNTYSGPAHLPISANNYEGRVVSLPNGTDVAIQPREVTMLYKLIDGRQKDFVDILTYYKSLTLNELERLNGYMEALQPEFNVQGQVVTDIESLIDVVEERNDDVFQQNAERVVAEQEKIVTEELNSTADVVLRIAGETDSNTFADAMIAHFGPHIVDRYPNALPQLVEFMFESDTPTKDSLVAFIANILDREDYTQKRIVSHLLQTPRWETTFRRSDS